MEETGKKWVLGICIYLVVKSILNLILGFSAGNVLSLLVAIVASVVLLRRVKYGQYIVAVYLVLIFLINLWSNVSNLSSNWIYLLEGILDVGAAAILVFENDVKAFFQQAQAVSTEALPENGTSTEGAQEAQEVAETQETQDVSETQEVAETQETTEEEPKA